MKKWLPYFDGLVFSILFFMFLIDLPFEVISQIIWMNNGNATLAFWIENLWKLLLAASIFVFPFFRLLLFPKKQWNN